MPTAAGPLARALDKLAAALEAAPNVEVDVERPPFLDAVQAAIEAGERLAVTYYVGSRDELTERRIDPQLTFLDRGRWYVVADDALAGAERHFRVDRIESLAPTGEHFDRRPVSRPTESGWFTGSDEARMVTLALPASASWVAETYPVRVGERARRRRCEVVLPVVSERWLERCSCAPAPRPGCWTRPSWSTPAAARGGTAPGAVRLTGRAQSRTAWRPPRSVMPASARSRGSTRAVASASARAS